MTLDPKRGLTVVEIMDAIHAGQIRGMYIMGENPAMSDPDAHHAREALAKLEHLVVQDIFLTETAFYADVVLPASAWPEKDGTVTNTNRQVQMGRQALPMPGDARQDWWIIAGDRPPHGARLGLRRIRATSSPRWRRRCRRSPNITWERLSARAPSPIPAAAPDEPGKEIVFGDGLPDADRARQAGSGALSCRPDEPPDAEYPMVLTTGRQLEHWHTGAMTRRASVLDALEPEAIACLSPDDLRRLGIGPATASALPRGAARSSSRRGVDDAVPAGLVFIPFCYAEAAANILTNPQLDPFGKIPEFKFCAAQVEPVSTKVAAAE